MGELLSPESIGINLAMLLLGGFVGHRLSLGRDKRREYNEVVDTMLPTLVSQIKDLENGVPGKPVSEEEVLKLRLRSGPLHRILVGYAERGYRRNAVPTYNCYAEPSIENYELAIKAARRLQLIARRK